MNYRISLILVFILLSCKQEAKRDQAREKVVFDKLVEAKTLMKYESEDIVIIDFRKPEHYVLGHIPEAINLWRTDLENKKYPYTGMRPDREELEAILSAKGVPGQAHLVVYDEKGSVDAARFWWLLKYYNFDSVSILNGGLSAWKEAGGQISKELPDLKQTEFPLTGASRDDMLVSREQLVSWLDGEPLAVTILDVRSEEEFRGKSMKQGASRAGRIPGSRRLEWNVAVDQHNLNRFRSIEELKAIFLENGIYETDTIIVYCHSGSRSSHTAFVLEELLKYKWIKNYDGSWTEWSYFSTLPIESDSLAVLNK